MPRAREYLEQAQRQAAAWDDMQRPAHLDDEVAAWECAAKMQEEFLSARRTGMWTDGTPYRDDYYLD